MGKEVVTKTKHLTTLSKGQQAEVLERVEKALSKLGLDEEDYSDALQNAQDGRLSDLEELISLKGFKSIIIK